MYQQWANNSVECLGLNQLLQKLPSGQDKWVMFQKLILKFQITFRCAGGDHESAFKFVQNVGVVTGGGFFTHVGCKPWPIDTYSKPPKSTECETSCEPYYKMSYEQDKVHTINTVYFSHQNNDVMEEILNNGPVVARLKMYRDFLRHSGDVYWHTYGEELGWHYVKIVGKFF